MPVVLLLINTQHKWVWVYHGLFTEREGMSSPGHRRPLVITDRAAWLEVHVKKESSKEKPTCKAKLGEMTNYR